MHAPRRERTPKPNALVAALLAAGLLGAPLAGQAGQATLALTGSAAPGVPGATLSSVYGYRFGPAGRLSWWAQLAGDGVVWNQNDHALYVDGGLFVRSGNAAPGLPGLVTKSLLTGTMLDAAGGLTWSGFLAGPGVGSTNDFAIWRDGTVIARKGDAAPAAGNGVTLQTVSSAGSDRYGRSYYGVQLAGSGVTSANDSALFRNGSLLYREGHGTSYAGLYYGHLSLLDINDSGQTLVATTMTGSAATSANDYALFVGHTMVAREGDAGPVGGTTLSGMSGARLNNAGQVAYTAYLSGSGVTADNDSAIVRDGSVVVRKGAAAPGIAGARHEYIASTLALNDAGQVAYVSRMAGGSVSSANSYALWRNNTLIARIGSSTTTDGRTLEALSSVHERMKLANGGQLLFDGYARDAAGTLRGGLFLGDGVELVNLVSAGDVHEGRTVTAVDSGSNNSYVINDHGQVAYRAFYEGAQSAAMLYTPDLVWRSAAGGSWDDATRWTLSLKPGAVHAVDIAPAASLTITGPSVDTRVRSLTLGAGNGIATLSLGAGVLSTVDGPLQVRGKGVLTGDGRFDGEVVNTGWVRGQNLTITGGLSNAAGGRVGGSGSLYTALNNQAGGEVRVETGDQFRLVGSAHANAGRTEVSGGRLEVSGSFVNQAAGRIYVDDGRLRFNDGLVNHGQLLVTYGEAVVHGAVDNRAGGRIVLSGRSDTTFYDDVVNNGELRISAGSSAVFFGQVSGAGAFTGNGTSHFEGGFAPGNSAARVGIAGDAIFGDSGNFFIELGGLQRGLAYDAVDVAGALTLGGVLQVSLIDGFTLAAGQSFGILTAAQGLSGRFDGLADGALVGQWGGVDLFIRYQDQGVLLATAPVPEPATWALWLGGLGLTGWRLRRRMPAAR
ncbi:MAG: PEP-CTERM sorting domain-containing protein [Rubrivivax sp.]|nr:PEP-CTERM sorting domain-containing protein [Rubrivivax sp.]